MNSELIELLQCPACGGALDWQLAVREGNSGPENLTMNQLVDAAERVTGKAGQVSHIPLPMMRVMARVMAPVNAQVARQIESGVIMDTTDMTFDTSETARRYPAITPTRFEDVIRRIHSHPPGTPIHAAQME